MSWRKTFFPVIFTFLSLLSFWAPVYGQKASQGILEHKGLEISVSKAEMVDWDPSNSYILVVLKIANNSDKTVRFIAKYQNELFLVDDLGRRYYGMYAQNVPESGLGINAGEQQRIAFAFQKPDLNCSMFTVSFSEKDLQGLGQAKGGSGSDAALKIQIPANKVIVWPKAKDRHETDFKKELNINGLIFVVNEAFIWRRPVKNEPSSSQPPSDSPAFLGVSFDLINTLMTNRVDVNGNFSFSLADDLGNKYSAVKPRGYSHKLKVTPERFPRIYPGESYRETVFFEAPAGGAKSVLFSINAASVGVKKEISVKITDEDIAE